MANRFLVTGVQIGILLGLNRAGGQKEEIENILKEIQEKQWVDFSENDIRTDVELYTIFKNTPNVPRPAGPIPKFSK